MTDRIAEIEARWANATKGPWYLERDDRDYGAIGYRVTDGAGSDLAQVSEETYPDEAIARAACDATAIAHAPEDVAYLLQRVRELEAGLHRAQELLARCRPPEEL